MAARRAIAEERSGWPLRRTVLFAAAIVLAAELILIAVSRPEVLSGTLFGPDCYMHLQRAFRLMMEGGSSFDPRINAPYGFAIHWTSLFDRLLVLGAEPLRFLGMAPKPALLAWGIWISPVLLVAALAALAWGVRPWLRGPAFLWLTVLVFTQAQFSGAFLAGRPDHHSLLLALMVGELAWLYALLDGRAGIKASVAAGVLAGLQIATSVEGLITVLWVALVLGLAWALYRRAALEAFAVYLTAAVVTMAVWLGWERGGAFFAPAYDRLSIVHVTALGAGAAAFALLAVMMRHRSPMPAARLAAFAIAGGFAAIPVAFLFPAFFLGPWPHLDAATRAWHGAISELQPLLPTDPTHMAHFFEQMTAPLLSLPLTVMLLRHGAPGERMAMLASLAGLLLFGGLALMQMRWAGELQAVALLPWTLTTLRIMRSSFALRLGPACVPLRSFVLAGALLLQIVPGMALAPDQKGGDAGPACPWDKAARALAARDFAPGAIILTEVWYGPDILWRTGLRVVGGPYEMPAALADTNAVLDGNADSAHAVLARRGVSLLLVCGDGDPRGFAGQLARGRAPAWLAPENLGDGLRGFHLYRVR
jgi:hypothetical protein